jgi:hypothetical protein
MLTPADAATLLRIFDVYVEPLQPPYWRLRIPWAEGTPLVNGETIDETEVVSLADAIISSYSDPARRHTFRADILRYIAEETQS